MTLITFSDGKPVLRDGKVGTEQECCCGCNDCLATIDTFVVVCADQEVCDAEQAHFQSLADALEANGWTVSLSTECGDAMCGESPPTCCYYLNATCSTLCWLQDHPCCQGANWNSGDYANNPNWFNLSQYPGFTWGGGGIVLSIPCLGISANLPYDINLTDEFGTTSIEFAPICNPLP